MGTRGAGAIVRPIRSHRSPVAHRRSRARVVYPERMPATLRRGRSATSFASNSGNSATSSPTCWPWRGTPTRDSSRWLRQQESTRPLTDRLPELEARVFDWAPARPVVLGAVALEASPEVAPAIGAADRTMTRRQPTTRRSDEDADRNPLLRILRRHAGRLDARAPPGRGRCVRPATPAPDDPRGSARHRGGRGVADAWCHRPQQGVAPMPTREMAPTALARSYDASADHSMPAARRPIPPSRRMIRLLRHARS